MNAIDWIRDNLQQPEGILPETLQAIGDFTLMWAIFEASEGEELNNMLQQITNFSDRLSTHLPYDLVEEEFAYWQSRYVKEGTKTDKFRHLRFSDQRQKDLVFRSFSSNEPTLRDKLETCLLITYRYRNNMFHGMKDVRNLNEQEQNFIQATSLLQKVLPYGRVYWLGFP
jgi:hypothetical protein